MYYEDILFIVIREENYFNLKIINFLIYIFEVDKCFYFLVEYSLKILIDDIIGIDKMKVIVYGLFID